MDDVKYFPYGEKELAYLRKKDKKLSAVIDRVGHIERAVDDDLFSAVVHHIVGQQISTKAQATVWARVQNALGTVDAEHVLGYGEANLQSLGISFRKAEYITDFAKKVHTGEFDLISIVEKPDEEVILELSALKGNRRVDSGNAAFILPTAPECVQLRRPRHFARHAHGLPPQGDRPRTVRAVPQTFFTVLQHRKFIFLGGLRRRAPRTHRPRRAETEEINVHFRTHRKR